MASPPRIASLLFVFFVVCAIVAVATAAVAAAAKDDAVATAQQQQQPDSSSADNGKQQPTASAAATPTAAADGSGGSGTASPKPKLTIGIVRDHNDVLHYWGQAVTEQLVQQGGAPVLHIDSHSDGSLPSVTDPVHPLTDKDSIEALNMTYIRSITDIGNFIPVAQYMRVAAPDAVWIKPDWPEQNFNFFNTSVQHKWIVTRRNKKSVLLEEQSYLCLAKTADSPADDVDSLPAVVRKAAQCFEPEEADLRYARHIEWHPMTLAAAINTINKIIPADKSFILDIDEDYFACMDPVLQEIADAPQLGAYFDELRRWAHPDLFCFSKDEEVRELQRDSINLLLREIVWNGLTVVNTTQPPFVLERVLQDEGEPDIPEDVASYWCEGREAGMRAIMEISKLARLLTRKLNTRRATMLREDYQFPDISCKVNGLFGVCHGGDISRPFVSREYIDSELRNIEKLLAKLPAGPTVVTVARSPEYIATGHALYIEAKVLDMLRRVYGDRYDLHVDYINDLKPVGDALAIDEMLLQRNESVVRELDGLMRPAEPDAFEWGRHERRAFDLLSDVNIVREYMTQREIGTLEMYTPDEIVSYKEWRIELEEERKIEVDRLLDENSRLLEQALDGKLADLAGVESEPVDDGFDEDNEIDEYVRAQLKLLAEQDKEGSASVEAKDAAAQAEQEDQQDAAVDGSYRLRRDEL